jgi:hypothetical protein
MTDTHATEAPALITETRICSHRDNIALINSPRYRKIPTPGQTGSAPFIWTADIRYAPERIVMIAADLPIRVANR